MASNTQTIRFRRPIDNSKPKPPPPEKPKNRHAGILQDQLRRSQRAPYVFGFSTAFRVLLLMRVAGAMYSNIQDCDEVFNFWEPLHYLDRGYGFQTWETSPQYSIRSWAYILLHLPPAKLAKQLLGTEKRPAFFAVRIFLAFLSALCETVLYRAVIDKINYRAGRYLFFMLLCSSGMWIAATSFLPSSFAMYANTLAFAYSIEPPSNKNMRRTLFSTLAFATGAIVGWPFALAVAIPFVVEELFLHGRDQVNGGNLASWLLRRWAKFATCVGVAALLAIPVVAMDTLFYGKLTIVPWNIIKYNVFPDPGRGPDLYGSEPPSFYVNNLILNFNILVPLAFAAIPVLFITSIVDRKRLGDKPLPGTTSPFVLLAFRLAPVYVWFGIMTAQPHKEERFMFPIYPLICFNAAVTVYLMRGWLEAAYIKFTQSPYKASRATMFSRFTLSVVTAFMVLSVTRTLALWEYYHAPMTIAYRLESQELPRLLNATGHITLPPPRDPSDHRAPEREKDEDTRIDLAPLKQMDLTLCLGKEWHRFPGHYLIPEGVHVRWIKSEFDGMLPGHFKETATEGGLLERLKGTMVAPSGLNDLNKEVAEFYIDVSRCDYLIDLDFPLHPTSSKLEPRYAADDVAWERVTCQKFLDARHSLLLTRAMWMPGSLWQQQNEYGEYCLLRHKKNVAKKEEVYAVRRDL
ncbi:asparagine-linked glycosylation 9 protein isoform a [Cristinia sonorae]|uniref:Mannosyltransferase n=1 Tax=Cristinia sonorae TaxID=1940300 RepID=A0A8K0XNS1_9AGAR|nr:asparagine-linked glycosylation 9 protein isoform a [Cristinia sonorae]